MHLTLKFLGDTEETLLAQVKESVATAAASISQFSLRFRGAGAFPDARRPQTLWIGLSEGQDSLGELAIRIDDALRALGIPREKREFTPHLTIGRVRSGSAAEKKSLSDLIRKHAEFDAATAVIRQVLVMASYLSPAGPTYEVQSAAPLRT
jgi:2'-5' RNA ligase